jgi:hypothetical protein
MMNQIDPLPLPDDEEEITHVPHEALIGPACDCGGETRLAGIEPHARDKHTDVRTYECKKCGVSTVVVVPYVPASKGGN